MSGLGSSNNKEILDKIARSHHRLCRLEAEMAINKTIMLLVTVLAVGIVIINRSR